MSYFIYQAKRIYYSESGKGDPVVFLHGNTASSRMFEPLLPLYEEYFKVILALVQCAEERLPLFFKPISELKIPLLLMGSAGDEMVRSDILDEYEAISGKTGAELCMFSGGGHPAILSNAEQAAEVIRKFLSRTDEKKA